MKAQISFTLNSDEINALGYQCMVESWDKKNFGKGKRKWLAEFDEGERKYLSAMYKRFYKWYLMTGPPQTFTFRNIKNLELIQRAINFFASI